MVGPGGFGGARQIIDICECIVARTKVWPNMQVLGKLLNPLSENVTKVPPAEPTLDGRKLRTVLLSVCVSIPSLSVYFTPFACTYTVKFPGGTSGT